MTTDVCNLIGSVKGVRRHAAFWFQPWYDFWHIGLINRNAHEDF
jgi:hypothetical protein